MNPITSLIAACDAAKVPMLWPDGVRPAAMDNELLLDVDRDPLPAWIAIVSGQAAQDLACAAARRGLRADSRISSVEIKDQGAGFDFIVSLYYKKWFTKMHDGITRTAATEIAALTQAIRGMK